jgi:DNA-binding CsgD family transcriptional regulator
VYAARAQAMLDRRDEALALAQAALAGARATGAPRGVGIALRTLGLVEEPPRREEALREAVEVLAGSGAKLERARALVELGASIRQDNRPREARGPLQEGFELADACGAVPLADRAVEELAASGVRPRRRAERDADALSPAERRVAMLAAEGRSNREIAQALFVTRKTVETQLGAAYRKLGISSRHQLAGHLGD